MYSVNDKIFNSYLEAIAEANTTNSFVIETATGTVRWEPAPEVSSKKIREYKNRLNAYNAQEAQKNA